jgi:hypothetical protein
MENETNNNKTIKLTNKIIRPGFSSAVPYLKQEDFINMTTEQEFENYYERIKIKSKYLTL